MAHPEWEIKAKVPLLNGQANMTPILNGNFCIHAIRLKLKKDHCVFIPKGNFVLSHKKLPVRYTYIDVD